MLHTQQGTPISGVNPCNKSIFGSHVHMWRRSSVNSNEIRFTVLNNLAVQLYVS